MHKKPKKHQPKKKKLKNTHKIQQNTKKENTTQRQTQRAVDPWALCSTIPFPTFALTPSTPPPPRLPISTTGVSQPREFFLTTAHPPTWLGRKPFAHDTFCCSQQKYKCPTANTHTHTHTHTHTCPLSCPFLSPTPPPLCLPLEDSLLRCWKTSQRFFSVSSPPLTYPTPPDPDPTPPHCQTASRAIPRACRALAERAGEECERERTHGQTRPKHPQHNKKWQ